MRARNRHVLSSLATLALLWGGAGQHSNFDLDPVRCRILGGPWVSQWAQGLPLTKEIEMRHCICTAGGSQAPDRACDLCHGAADYFSSQKDNPEKESAMVVRMADEQPGSNITEGSKTGDTQA